MLKFPASLLVIGGLCALPLACSSSDPGPSSHADAGAPSAGSTSHAGNASGGSNAAPGGTGGSAAGSNNGGGGANSAGSSSGGAGAGGVPSNAGSGGTSGGASGSAGSSAVSCVSGTGTQPVGDKSVLDRKTCLTWTKAHTATTMTNKDAAKYCASLDQDGISDWRVPHPEELVTWPDLATDSTAYITGPIYIPTAGTDADGCTGNSHSCNIAKYNDTSVTCAWQGVGFTGWVECVSGTPTAGTASASYSAANCSPCNGEQSMFKEFDCSQYTN